MNALKATPGTQAAEASGKQVLLYEPSGLLGGTFTCSRCGAVAPQPDLLDHRPECQYLKGQALRAER